MTPDRPAAEGQPFDTAQAAEIPEPDKPVEAPSGRAVGPADGTSPGRAGRVREPIVIHMPVNIRSLSLALLAMFAGLLVLYWAKAVFIPFMLGLIFSYALSPLVNWMELRRVPRWLGGGAAAAGHPRRDGEKRLFPE